MNPPRLPFCVLACLLPAGLAAQSSLGQHGEVVHASGMPIPGSNGASPNDFPPGAVLQTAAAGAMAVQPVIDANGTLLYRARATDDDTIGIDASNAWAIYMGRANGDLRMVMRQDDPAPGLPAGIRIRNNPSIGLPFRSFRISPFGERLVIATGLGDPVTPANTPLTADSAMFWGTAGALQVLAREGDLVPTLGGGQVYGEIDANSNIAFLLNASGTVLFRNRMMQGIGGVTALDDAILLVGTPGNLTTFLREGDPWTGVGASGEVLDRGNTVSSGEYPVLATNMNAAGQILHDLHFRVPSGSATSTANDRALAIWTAGIDVIVAREGDQAPGMPAGAVFADSSATAAFATLPTNSLDKSGGFVFTTTFPVGPGGVTAGDNHAMFEGTAGSLSLLLREGDPAPASLGAGVLWGETHISMQRNDAGQIAFRSTLAGAVTAANDTAVFVGSSGNYTLLAREGDPAPGLPGFTFTGTPPAVISLTERGHVVLVQEVTDGTPRHAWFSYTPEQGVRLFFDPFQSWTTVLGSSTQPANLGSSGSSPSGDTSSVSVNNNGDVCGLLFFQGSDATTLGGAIVRGHVGSFPAVPASVPAAGGTSHKFFLDCGPTHGNRLYLVLATALGTRPGFPSPLGPQNVPLNFDPLWTMMTINAANSPVWINSLGFTDANGVGIGSAGFVMPPGFPGFLGTTLHHAALVIDGSLTTVFVTEPSAVKLY